MDKKFICKFISSKICSVLLDRLGIEVDKNFVYFECLKLLDEFLCDEVPTFSTEYLWLLVLDKIVDKYDISYDDAFDCFCDIYSEVDFIKPFCDSLLCQNAGKSVEYDYYTDGERVINNIYDAFYMSSELGRIDELQNCGIRTNLFDDDSEALIKIIDDYYLNSPVLDAGELMMIISKKCRRLFMLDDSIYSQINDIKDYKKKIKFVKEFCLKNNFATDEDYLDYFVSPIKSFAEKLNYLANFSDFYYDSEVFAACSGK